MSRFLLLLIATILLSRCDNSAKQAEQQARDKFVADSVTQVIQAAAAAKQNLEDQKNQLRQSISQLERQEAELQQAGVQIKASLTAANDNLRSVSEFHLLRSSSERQNEIRNASLKVNELEQALANLNDRYTEVQNKLSEAKGQLAGM